MKHPIPFRKTPLALAITASLASPTWVQAAPGDPLGPEFQVNTYTTDRQSAPAVTIDADGDFVVVWTSSHQDGSGLGIYAQRYAGAASGETLTTAGLYAPTEGRFRLRTEHASGPADSTFRFGPLASSRLPLAGDWNGNGIATVGLYDPATSRFYLKNSHAGGAAELSFRFGLGGFG